MNLEITADQYLRREDVMNKIILVTAIVLVSSVSFGRDTYVHGYTRPNGTYVQPYHRTEANDNPYDNYSTKGNVNPYTGKEGTVDPYKANYKTYDSNFGHDSDSDY